jgi:hypothetical protein
MALSLELGIDQAVIDGHFKPPAIRGNQGDRFNTCLEILEQLGCQTDSLIRVVSDLTINQLNF